MWLHLAADAFTILALRAHQFIVQLEAEPEAGRGAEVAAEAQIVFRRAAASDLFSVSWSSGFLA
jgi:hypothetical protein